MYCAVFTGHLSCFVKRVVHPGFDSNLISEASDIQSCQAIHAPFYLFDVFVEGFFDVISQKNSSRAVSTFQAGSQRCLCVSAMYELVPQTAYLL